jgi:hypothetical protein
MSYGTNEDTAARRGSIQPHNRALICHYTDSAVFQAEQLPRGTSENWRATLSKVIWMILTTSAHPIPASEMTVLLGTLWEYRVEPRHHHRSRGDIGRQPAPIRPAQTQLVVRSRLGLAHP